MTEKDEMNEREDQPQRKEDVSRERIAKEK